MSICLAQAQAAHTAVYPLPATVHNVLHALPGAATAILSLHTGTCALYCKGEVLLWQADAAAQAVVASRRLPYASEGEHFLAVPSVQVRVATLP